MKLLLCAVALLFFSACSTTQKEAEGTTFYFIRHAETIDSDENDKVLSPEGINRADKWVEVLTDVEFDAIYSTNYKRTMATAKPIAEKEGLDIENYHPIDVDLEKLVEKHKGQDVLVVGHSNTTPALVNTLLGEERYAQIEHTDHDNLYTVSISSDNEVSASLISTDE